MTVWTDDVAMTYRIDQDRLVRNRLSGGVGHGEIYFRRIIYITEGREGTFRFQTSVVVGSKVASGKLWQYRDSCSPPRGESLQAASLRVSVPNLT